MGGWFGMKLAIGMAPKRRVLSSVFAGLTFLVAAYMLVRIGLELSG